VTLRPIVFDGRIVDPEGYAIELLDRPFRDFVTHTLSTIVWHRQIIYTLLEHAYDEDTIDGERRIVLRLSPEYSPRRSSGVSLGEVLNEKALEVFRLLDVRVFWSSTMTQARLGDDIEDKTRSEHRSRLLSITKLRKFDGDYQDRDTTKQVRSSIESLVDVLRGMLVRGFDRISS